MRRRAATDYCEGKRHEFAYRRLGAYVANRDAPKRLDRWMPVVADRYARWLGATGVKPVTVRHYVCAVAQPSRLRIRTGGRGR